jgi:guanylate kinase
MSGQLFVFSAPSGTGKSTIIKALREKIPATAYSVSHTTRPPRSGEKDGVDYFFVREPEFKDMISRGQMVEWAAVYGFYYGTSSTALRSRTASGLDVLLDVDTVGARNIKKVFNDSVLVFILPPSLEELERRLIERGTDSAEVIGNRMTQALSIISECVHYDYIIVNEYLDEAVNRAESIIHASRCRTLRAIGSVEERFRLPSLGAVVKGGLSGDRAGSNG